MTLERVWPRGTLEPHSGTLYLALSWRGRGPEREDKTNAEIIVPRC
jgi:hypothetical protein